MSNEIQWCNWTFLEVIKPSNKYGIQRDCDNTPLVKQDGIGPFDYDESVTLVLLRGDSRNWKAYKASLEPTHQFYPPPFNSKCPNCNRYINGVNPNDNGETWRKENDQ